MTATADLLNAEQAAELLHVSAYTAREYARHGVVPATKLGKRWLFPRAELVAHIAARAQAKQPRPATPVVEVTPARMTPTSQRPRRVVIFPDAPWRTPEERAATAAPGGRR